MRAAICASEAKAVKDGGKRALSHLIMFVLCGHAHEVVMSVYVMYQDVVYARQKQATIFIVSPSSPLSFRTVVTPSGSGVGIGVEK